MSLVALLIAHSLFVKVGEKISEYFNSRNKKDRSGVEELAEDDGVPQQTPVSSSEEELEKEDSAVHHSPACPIEEDWEEDYIAVQHSPVCPIEEDWEEDYIAVQHSPVCPIEEDWEEDYIAVQHSPVCPIEEDWEEDYIAVQHSLACPIEEDWEEDYIAVQHSLACPIEEDWEEDYIAVQHSPVCPIEEDWEEDYIAVQHSLACPIEENWEEDYIAVQHSLACPIEEDWEEDYIAVQHSPVCPIEEDWEEDYIAVQHSLACPIEEDWEEDYIAVQHSLACPIKENWEEDYIAVQHSLACPIEEDWEEDYIAVQHSPVCPIEEDWEEDYIAVQHSLACPIEEDWEEDYIAVQHSLACPIEENWEEDYIAVQHSLACPIEENWEEDYIAVQHSPVCPTEENWEEDYTEKVRIEEINHWQYEIGKFLGQGSFGAVHEGRRIRDGLEVAIKYVSKERMDSDRLSIMDHPDPIPFEIALQLMANKAPRVPEILQILDWEEREDCYILVLERMLPCLDLWDYLVGKDKISENMARVIMRQATIAAYECCRRGVFHRDIKLDNLLFNPKTLEVKLIDFGCGDVVKDTGYNEMAGTEPYLCPEAYTKSVYFAEPATVYSLGVTLFVLVCGDFPTTDDCYRLDNNIFYQEGLSEECLRFIRACMRTEPEKRIPLDVMLDHEWIQDPNDESSGEYEVNDTSDNTSRESDSWTEQEVALESSCNSSTKDFHEDREKTIPTLEFMI